MYLYIVIYDILVNALLDFVTSLGIPHNHTGNDEICYEYNWCGPATQSSTVMGSNSKCCSTVTAPTSKPKIAGYFTMN